MGQVADPWRLTNWQANLIMQTAIYEQGLWGKRETSQRWVHCTKTGAYCLRSSPQNAVTH